MALEKQTIESIRGFMMRRLQNRFFMGGLLDQMMVPEGEEADKAIATLRNPENWQPTKVTEEEQGIFRVPDAFHITRDSGVCYMECKGFDVNEDEERPVLAKFYISPDEFDILHFEVSACPLPVEDEEVIADVEEEREVAEVDYSTRTFRPE